MKITNKTVTILEREENKNPHTHVAPPLYQVRWLIINVMRIGHGVLTVTVKKTTKRPPFLKGLPFKNGGRWEITKIVHIRRFIFEPSALWPRPLKTKQRPRSICSVNKDFDERQQ